MASGRAHTLIKQTNKQEHPIWNIPWDTDTDNAAN